MNKAAKQIQLRSGIKQVTLPSLAQIAPIRVHARRQSLTPASLWFKLPLSASRTGAPLLQPFPTKKPGGGCQMCRINLQPVFPVVTKRHMKNIIWFLVLLAAAVCGRAQVTNQIQSDDYAWKSAPVEKRLFGSCRVLVDGAATDFASMHITVVTLEKGKADALMGKVGPTNLEEMIVVKDGTLNLTLNGAEKILGPGSVAVILPGAPRSFANFPEGDTTFYVLSYCSKSPVDAERGKKAGGSFVMDWNDVKYVPREDGAGGTRQFFSRATAMGQRMDLHATLLNPGQSSHAAHHHRAEEMIIMLEGDVEEYLGPAEKDGKSKKATAGDIIYLVSNEYHAIHNIGTKPALYFAFQFE
jgi:(S)-ureidoglycine aminohydrolase